VSGFGCQQYLSKLKLKVTVSNLPKNKDVNHFIKKIEIRFQDTASKFHRFHVSGQLAYPPAWNPCGLEAGLEGI
jgi:desulfoferrodoxin (superoxide reductase-like protein)